MDTCLHLARPVDAPAIQAISAPVVLRSHAQCQRWNGLGYLDLADPAAVQKVSIMGIQHKRISLF